MVRNDPNKGSECLHDQQTSAKVEQPRGKSEFCCILKYICYIYRCNVIFQQFLLMVGRKVDSRACVMAAKRGTVGSASFA